MNRLIGHLIRIVGLFIEMVGVWAVYVGRNDKEPTLVSLPGGRAMPAAWLAVLLGFILWLIGTIIVSLSRTRRRIAHPEKDNLDAQRPE
jgi:hypothetical protein